MKNFSRSSHSEKVDRSVVAVTVGTHGLLRLTYPTSDDTLNGGGQSGDLNNGLCEKFVCFYPTLAITS